MTGDRRSPTTLQRSPLLLALPMFLVVFCTTAPARAAESVRGLGVFSAETIFEDGKRITLTHVYRRRAELYRGYDRVHDGRRRVLRENLITLGLEYGLRRDLTLSLFVPLVERTLENRDGAQRTKDDTLGLGDVAAAAKFRFLRITWPRSAFNLALTAVVAAPTGEARERKDGALLPPEVQSGSGAWSATLAFATTLSLNRFRADAGLRYQASSEGEQDLTKGEVLVATVSADYRFWHEKYPGPTAKISGGLVYRYENESRVSGRPVHDSGSDVLSLKLGITSHPVPQVDLVIEVDLPLAQRYRGEQLGRGTATTLGFGFRF